MNKTVQRGMKGSPFDSVSAAESLARPGMDPRQWISYGTVANEANADIVIFDEDAGQPYVKVVLHPSEIPVYCRVSSHTGGSGEGEWFPFVQGDEVLVAIPGGHERGGCVIIGRLNNMYDNFPMDSVAGQDPTTNTFAFRRRRTPVIEEYAGPVMIRSALSGAMFSLDTSGTVTVRDGEGAALQISPDVIAIQSASYGGAPPSYMFQFDMQGKHIVLRAKDALLSLSATGAIPELSTMTVPGQLSLGSLGNAPQEHVVTTEALAHILEALLPLLPFAIPMIPPAAQAAVVGALQLAAATPLSPLISSAIQAAFSTMMPKPANPSGQLQPGIGCPGLFVG